MKITPKRILTAALSAMTLAPLLLVSCAEVDIETELDERPIRLSAAQTFDPTRAATTDLQGPVLEESQRVNVYITGSDDRGTTWKDYDASTVCTASEPKGEAGSQYNDLTPDAQPYYLVGTPSDIKARIYATHPTTVVPSLETFTVSDDQREKEGYLNSDLMFVRPLEHWKSNETVKLPFEHKMAKIIISAIGNPGITMDETLTLDGLKRSIAIDVPNTDFKHPNTDEIQTNTDQDLKPEKGQIVMTNGGAVLIPPQEVTTSSEVGYFVTATGHLDSNPTETLTARFHIAAKRFLPGQVYRLTLAIGEDNFTKTETISGWSEDYSDLTLTPSGGFLGITIDPIDDDENVVKGSDTEDGYYIYNKTKREPQPAVYYGTVDQKKLTYGEDYIFRYVDNVNAGTAQVLAIGQNYYYGLAATRGFTIKRAPAKVSFPEGSQRLGDDGTGIEFELNQAIDAIKAVNTGDGAVTYTAEKEDGTTTDVVMVDPIEGTLVIQNVGECYIRATASDGTNYYYTDGTGNTEVNNTDRYKVKIKAKPATESNFSVTYEPKYFTYNGEEQHLTSLVVSDGDHTLAQDIDYIATLTNNIDKGKAKLTIEGQKNYDAKFDIEIEIRQAQPTITVDKNTLAMGIHQNTAPQNRRKTRTATTESWAADNLRYSLDASSAGYTYNATTQTYSNNVISINQKGLITGLSAGTATVYVDVLADASTKGNWKAATRQSFNVTVVNSDFDFTLSRNASGKVTYTYATSGILNSNQRVVYKGAYAKWVCPATGEWQLDCWGAQGAGTPASWPNNTKTSTVYAVNRGQGGRGAHIAGRVRLTKGQELYVFVGEEGRNILPGESRTTTQLPQSSTYPTNTSTGASNQYFELCGYAWNGGGNVMWGGVEHASKRYNILDPVYFPISGGGGATDISLRIGTYTGSAYMKGFTVDANGNYKKDTNGNPIYAAHASGTAIDSMSWKAAAHLYSRIIVAGGGGGAIYYDSSTDGKGFGDGGDGGGRRSGVTGYPGTDGLFNDHGNGGTMNRGGYGGVIYNWAIGNATTTAYNGKLHAKIYTDGPADGGMSGQDGMFGEGGYFTCVCEGNGCGGGGWYGGGAAGQSGPNGSGGGGSSYLWCSELASYYPSSTYAPSNVSTNANYFPYLTEVIADTGMNAGDGKAMITAVSIDDVQSTN